MTITELREQLPEFAKDIKINLGVVLSTDGAPELTNAQIFGVALACAYATRHATVIAAISADAAAVLSPEAMRAAQGAATIMAMNNIYYRFTHLVQHPEIAALPAKLRMTIIGNPGVEKNDFELMSLAVSAINGCGMCMESHTKHLEDAGVPLLAIQSAVRIAAVINATAQALIA